MPETSSPSTSSSSSSSSRLILGCMGLGGGWDSQPLSEADIAKAQAAVEAALSVGITRFDHADIYTLGKAEQSFGELFKRQPSLRARLQLQSKCSIRFADATSPQRYDLSCAHILASVEASLKRLHTDHLEVLLLHRPDPLMEAAELAEAWTRLKAAGKVGRLGVSNMHAAQMRMISAAIGEPLAANQLEMSLLKRDWLDSGTCFNDGQAVPAASAWGDTLDFCQREGVELQAWGALARGLYSGAAPADAPVAVQATARLVADLAAQQGVSREALVLAWLLRHPAGIQAVIGSSDPARIRACAEAQQLSLSRELWYQLYLSARGRALP
ncbi:aldo/keto reductase family oxidoreductase [Paucibacter sp. Y2R2-4]|uniref:aldo/keto reductase n=1 Tax=Paucibacter sp. Y2R2-4 TaxID=2893553 RepID=UPI0021E4EDB8|nr:aldo/keto reductase [Paucibacter sp. Y2R2-4]MCV2349412.1 aldo/keto reductase [Paucibacter sp. Y2R2-4]